MFQVQQFTAQAAQLLVTELAGQMMLGLLVGMIRTAGRAVLPPAVASGSAFLQTVPELVPVSEMLERIRRAREELGAPSLAELLGWGRADRWERAIRRELREELGSTSYDEADALHGDPLGTVESWLEPGGYAHGHPILKEVAQVVMEAAEEKMERARQALTEAAVADINYRISQRTSYGRREEVTEAPGVVIVWSNASASWYAARPVRQGERLTLDANQVFLPYPKRRLEAVLHKLEPLPLSRYSYEAIARKREQAQGLGAEGRMESDERWLEGLRMLGLAVYAGPGYSGATPIPSIKEVAGLEHIGGGNLSDGKRVYRLRVNPETGTRFYVVEETA